MTLLTEDRGRLVACGGLGGVSTCVSWRRGQDTWTHYSTLRWVRCPAPGDDCSLFREKRAFHSAAGVEGGRVMLLGGRYGGLTGEISGE